MPTKAQQDKFALFERHSLKDQNLQLLRQAVEVAELQLKDIGDTWGVTVCVDSDTILRLNVGNVSQLSVYKGSNDKQDPTSEIYFLYLAVVDRELGIRGEPRGLRWRKGFVDHVDDSAQLIGPFDEWQSKVFDNKRISRAFRAHAQAALRRLPNPNWHNPMVDKLLR